MALTKLDISMLEDVSGANNLVKLDTNAKIPATSGAGLSVKPGPFTSSSDPAIDSNKALGTEWLNKTSGNMFICTDATAGANVWTNVGAGTGNIQPHSFQGSNYGISYGGYAHPSAARTNQVDRTSFTTDGNATDVGDMTIGRDTWSGHSSPTHGYACGGYSPGNYSPNTGNTIDRLSFASAGAMVDVGDMTRSKRLLGGVSSATYGYICGGHTAANDPSGPATNYNEIERFQFAASSNGVDVGDLLSLLGNAAGHSDQENAYGYVSSGSPNTNVIQRFAMASSGNSTDVGDLTVSWGERAGNSSLTHGYTTGKAETATSSNAIDKFAFAASSNSTDIGDMPQQLHESCGCSSTTNGYTMGGGRQGQGGAYGQGSDHIFKFSFTTDGNGTDIGNLSGQIGYLGRNGSQY